MDKESKIELQKIDCNCNDCKFMDRDFEALKSSIEKHRNWQLRTFERMKNNLLEKAKDWELKGLPDKAKPLRKEANKMKFQFDKKSASVQFGNCGKLNKPISFIPNTCQLDTQDCFLHRKDDLITVSSHGYKRAKERMSWNRSAIEKMAKKAWGEGLTHKQAKGRIKKYLSQIHMQFFRRHGKGSKAIMRIHGEVVYFFIECNLITLYRVDGKFIKHLNS